MYLIEILLPLTDNKHRAFGPEYFIRVQQQLTEKFGGLTAFTRTPAEGLWKPDKSSKPQQDDIVIFEVLSPRLNKTWWQQYKDDLKTTFQQKDMIIRVTKVELI